MQATLIPVGATRNSTEKHLLERFPVVLGRGGDADVFLPDPLASRRHCVIRATDGTLVVEDLDSCNGTLVNGCRVDASPLMPGDQLVIGSHRLRVVYERSSLNPPPPIVYAPGSFPRQQPRSAPDRGS